MAFVACGLNYKTAPLDVREKIALPPAMQTDFLQNLIAQPAVNEAAILSTCNRTEIYCETDDPASLVPWLAKEHQIAAYNLLPFFYMHHGEQGIRHTLRVASGLDSMMLGEPQILGQMKQAYKQACEAGTIKANLRFIFEYVFKASKRVRTHSGIGASPISVAYAAVQLISKLFPNSKTLDVFLIGSGEIASLVAKYLHKQGIHRFRVASRTRENAQLLAMNFNGEALTIGDIPEYLSQADVVISATACPLPFINKSLVENALTKRHHAPMFFLDLAVPRDIEPDVGDLPGVSLCNIDDLQKMTDDGMNERRSAALQAEQLVDCELDNYIRWHRSLRAKEVICDYRNRMQLLAEEELRRAQGRLANGLNQDLVLREFCDRLVNKLTHQPTIGLRQAAWDGKQELLDLTHYLFNTSNDQLIL
ncbi:glutamyl tRNA reductase [Legionella beliardensis]|uniref:Glutamyl-tRNA reductase n=1 Tax=Legionella beliardensis TaxID=91822 RepID=A0A378I3N3_9GAMM|nr:glutamyl-tRNA reductase [Legionella beliardensis]STX29472.1 glutamyl tRNA reductase [Legionella beliardensis]